MLYTLAEMENVRTIARRDIETSKQFAIQSFAKQLLDVADNLSRAIDSVPKEALENKVSERKGLSCFHVSHVYAIPRTGGK